MLEPWNDASICTPPVCTLTGACRNDVEYLTATFKRILTVLKQQSPLHQEAAILSRFIYKFDKKFRNDIGFRYLKKVKTALGKYNKINFLRDVQYFESALPSKDEQDLYLPSRQMLEYVLIRLMTFSKLMVRICVCSKQSAIFYYNRFKRGDSYWMSLIPYALLCRLWSISKVLLQHCCRWYPQLYKFHQKLKSKGLEFLPKSFEFPTSLNDWLEMNDLEEFGRFEWTVKREIEIDPDLVENDDGTFDNILEYVNQINEADSSEPVVNSMAVPDVPQIENLMPLNIQNIEQGEIVSRDTFMKMMTKTSKEKTTGHAASTVTNKQSLEKFLSNEEKYRNKGSSKSLTNHLSFMQWQALRNSLNKLSESLSNNRKIERKFQKIWKEKCLDYME